MYKVIVSQKKESTLNHLNKLFLKQIQTISRWPQHETLAYCPPTWACRPGKTWPSVDFWVGLNENASSFFATRCRFWSGKVAVSQVTAVHKAALPTIRHYKHDEMEIELTNHCRLASCKGGVWNNESLSKLFGSRWANKVKINAYSKTIKVFYLAYMSTCCWGLPKPKYEPFKTHNRGTLKQVCHT